MAAENIQAAIQCFAPNFFDIMEPIFAAAPEFWHKFPKIFPRRKMKKYDRKNPVVPVM